MEMFEGQPYNGLDEEGTDRRTLMRAKDAWESLAKFREDANRSARFVFGDQWSDKVYDATTNRYVKEEDLIIEEGNTPLKNNRIAPMVRSILGQFSENQTEPVCVSRDKEKQSLGDTMSATMQYVYQTNKLWELDRRGLESFIISSLVAFRSYYAWDSEEDMSNVFTDLVNHNRIFFKGYNEDPRLRGLDLVGELHDLPLFEVLSKFSNGSREMAKKIREEYRLQEDETFRRGLEQLTGQSIDNLDFFRCQGDMCRVIEVWTKESRACLRCHDTLHGDYYLADLAEEYLIEEENERRRKEQLEHGVSEENLKLIDSEFYVDVYWMSHFLTPTGLVLQEGETPYKHNSHPYTIKIHSFFNGKSRSLISDAIDIQKHINRLIIMQDFIQKNAAKGVMLMPEDAVPSLQTMNEIASEWKKSNGIIFYKARAGVPPPQQLISNASNSGVYDMLNTQLRMIDDVSGVSSALQGQKAPSNTPASLYAMQTQNSAISLVDLMESFKSAREDRDRKNMKLVLQYYTEKRYVGVSGGSGDASFYDPDKIKDVDFDLSLGESTSSQVYRAMQNEFLFKLFEAGAIDVRTLLQNSTLAYSDALLESIDKREAELKQAQESIEKTQMQQQSSSALSPELQGLEVPQELLV